MSVRAGDSGSDRTKGGSAVEQAVGGNAMGTLINSLITKNTFKLSNDLMRWVDRPFS